MEPVYVYSVGIDIVEMLSMFAVIAKQMQTHVNHILVISNQQIPEDPGLVQVPQRYHILHALYGRRVHRFDTSLGSQPLLLMVGQLSR
jgi:hypothetical protein